MGIDPKKVFFTSDTHFGEPHKLFFPNVRTFGSADEMYQHIADNWNRVIDDDCIVFHLGDFGDFKAVEKYQLKGKIYLIPDKDDLERYSQEYMLRYIEKVLEPNTRIRISDQVYVLIHNPEEARFKSEDDFILFGHWHRLALLKLNGLNVSTDCHDYMPIDAETVRFYKDIILPHCEESIFFETVGEFEED